MKTMPWINALFILPHTRCYNFGTIRDAIMQISYPVQFFYFAGKKRKEKKKSPFLLIQDSTAIWQETWTSFIKLLSKI